jgi:hypothetical protein
MEPIRIDLGRFASPIMRAEPIGDGFSGHRGVKIGEVSGRVVLTIDVDRLARLHARKTLRNRSGRATLSDGAIVFLASDVKRVLHDDQRSAV